MSQRPLGSPVLETRHGAGSFPLAPTTLPSTAAELQQSLHDGYARGVELNDDVHSVRVAGASLRGVDAIHVDLSNAPVKQDFEPDRIEKNAAWLGVMRVPSLHYRAWPMKLDGASMYAELRGVMATLYMLRDSRGVTVLSLAGADEGYFLMWVKGDELRDFLLKAARRGASRSGITISSLEMNLATPQSRSLVVDMRCTAWWVVLPMTFQVRGRVDIDRNMVASFNDIDVRGLDPGGALAAAFVAPRVDKFAEQVRPLMRFADGTTTVRNVELDASDGLRLQVWFGK